MIEHKSMYRAYAQKQLGFFNGSFQWRLKVITPDFQEDIINGNSAGTVTLISQALESGTELRCCGRSPDRSTPIYRCCN